MLEKKQKYVPAQIRSDRIASTHAAAIIVNCWGGKM